MKSTLAAAAAVSCLGVSVLADYTQEALNDQIVSLPGTEDLEINFKQFSGYLQVSDSKNLHYWMVESQRGFMQLFILFLLYFSVLRVSVHSFLILYN